MSEVTLSVSPQCGECERLHPMNASHHWASLELEGSNNFITIKWLKTESFLYSSFYPLCIWHTQEGIFYEWVAHLQQVL